MNIKNEFVALMKKRGFKSVREFSIACGMESSNIYSNLVGRTSIGIGRLFIYANTMGVPVSELMEIVYPEGMKENRKAIKARDEYINQLSD